MKMWITALIIFTSSLADAATNACSAGYNDLYAKGKVDIRVIFGYKDARPARFVGDRHERLAFVQRLLAPCEKEEQACGFERNIENADLFTKTIAGPDLKPVIVRLIVTNSSVGADDESNRKEDRQKWQSAYAKSAYLNGLEKADIVLYNGHSRFGGGPDFEPPQLRRDNDVDPSYYMAKQEGFQKTRQRVRLRAKADKGGLKILGLFSCASAGHFSDAIHADARAGNPNARFGMISSQALIYYSDAFESSLGAINGLLKMECGSELGRSLRPEGTKSGSHLDGFFAKR